MDERNFPPEKRRELDDLYSLTYEELRRLASAVRRKDPGATASPTTLVNEAWLKLARTPGANWESPLHFKRLAAQVMRQVLLDAARKRITDKRGGMERLMVTLGEDAPVVSRDEELVALDDALARLERMNPRQAAMVEGRFFGGMEMAEIAELLQVSEATVLRDWRAARAWLARQLRGDSGEL